MSLVTVYELRTLVKVSGHADCALSERYDELQRYDAEVAYQRECSRAKSILGKPSQLKTHHGSEVEGEVTRVLVELCWAKYADGFRIEGPHVVGATKTEAGCKTLIE